ncbi:MAG: TraB/GumN family protein [Xanthomonadaceae bacterium]|nr:TraB/GumN family protein [Xanthomonadaceae bacterium]
MKSSLLAFALTALLAPVAWANQAAPAAPPAADIQAAAPARHPLLWKVSDADNAVYLLGSFHLLKPDDYPLPAEVDRAFDDSQQVLFEVDPAVMTAPETVTKMQQYMGYSDGKTLSQVMPRPMLEKLDTLLAAGGGSVAAMEHQEPWAVNLGLVLSISQALGFRPELGLDRQLMAKVAQAGKTASGLETIDEQLQAMDSIPYAEQNQGIDEFLTDPQKTIRQLNDMHAWWRAGDVEKLDSRMRAEMASKTPESYRLLDVQRNDAWLPKLQARLDGVKGSNTLVVVGALHLLGSDGLVEKLRAKGYKVERICDRCTP